MANEIIMIEFQGDVWPWSLGIMATTWSRWSHVVMHTNAGTIIDATPAHGTKEREPSRSRTRWSKFYDVVPRSTPELRQTMYDRAKVLEGAPYDWGWVVGYGLNRRDWQDLDEWVCFELVAFVIEPYFGAPKDLSRIVGRHLDRHLEKIGFPVV